MKLATKKQRLHLMERDIELMTLLDCHPLTAEQILAVSSTFEEPFSQLRLVQRRLRRLKESKYLRCWPYATTCSSPYYYKLTQTAYRLLHGDDTQLPGRRTFEEISQNHHKHTQALGDFLTHLLVSAHKCGLAVRQFSRENSLRIDTAPDTLYPDCAFQLAFPDGKALNYVVELDNGSERVRSTKATESLERKIRGYDRHQRQFDALDPGRYVVLFITTRSTVRTDHILDAARSVMQNPNRTVFLATELRSFLTKTNPLSSPCLRDNRGRKRGLLPSTTPQRTKSRALMSLPVSA